MKGFESVMFQEKSKKFLKWLGVTGGGALVGAVISAMMMAANPGVQVIDYGISMSLNKNFGSDNEKIRTPKNYANLCAMSDWAASSSLYRPFIEYDALIESLYENEERMSMVRWSFGKFFESVGTLRSILAKVEKGYATRNDYDDFYELWEQNDGLIYGSIRGDYRRGTYSIDTSVTYSSAPVYKLFEETLPVFGDNSTLWVVNNGGALASTLIPETKRDLPLQKFVAFALAHLNVSALREILERVERQPEVVRVANDLLAEIELVRQSMSRVTVTALVSNTGGRPLVVLPYATLTIHAAALQENGRAFGETIRLDLEHRNESGEAMPVQVNQGDAKLITFATPRYLMDIPHHQVILKAYDVGNISSSFQINLKSSGFFQDDSKETDEGLFLATSIRVGM